MPLSQSTCWTVIQAAAAGSQDDRAQFVDRYAPLVRAYLGARWRDSACAGELEDTVQEVFVDCFRPDGVLARADPTRAGGFRAFLYGVLRLVALRVESRHARERARIAPGAVNSAGQTTDFAYHYAAEAGSSFVVSGTAFSYMSATDTVGGMSQTYFNVGAGFLVNTGVAKNPGKDYAYVIDSPGNDTFVGGSAYSYMFIQNPGGSFAELDTAYGFALVFAQSFVGGADTATNNDPSHNILAGFKR